MGEHARVLIVESSAPDTTTITMRDILNIVNGQHQQQEEEEEEEVANGRRGEVDTPRPGSVDFPPQWREVLQLARIRRASEAGGSMAGGGAAASETTHSHPGRREPGGDGLVGGLEDWYISDAFLTGSTSAAATATDVAAASAGGGGTLLADIERHNPPRSEAASLLCELLTICNDSDLILGSTPELDESLTPPSDIPTEASEHVKRIIARVEATSDAYAAAKTALIEEFRAYVQARIALQRRQVAIRAYNTTLTSFLDNTATLTDLDPTVVEAQHRVCAELQRMVHTICNQTDMRKAVDDVRTHWVNFSSLRAACSPIHTCDLAMTCTACMTRVSDVVFSPCGHVICNVCAPSLRKCHMCRHDIGSRIRIYK